MEKENLLAGINIIFETEVNETDRSKAEIEHTYLFEKMLIKDIEVKVTTHCGKTIEVNPMYWETNVDEAYFKEEE